MTFGVWPLDTSVTVLSVPCPSCEKELKTMTILQWILSPPKVVVTRVKR